MMCDFHSVSYEKRMTSTLKCVQCYYSLVTLSYFLVYISQRRTGQWDAHVLILTKIAVKCPHVQRDLWRCPHWKLCSPNSQVTCTVLQTMRTPSLLVNSTNDEPVYFFLHLNHILTEGRWLLSLPRSHMICIFFSEENTLHNIQS